MDNDQKHTHTQIECDVHVRIVCACMSYNIVLHITCECHAIVCKQNLSLLSLHTT